MSYDGYGLVVTCLGIAPCYAFSELLKPPKLWMKENDNQKWVSGSNEIRPLLILTKRTSLPEKKTL